MEFPFFAGSRFSIKTGKGGLNTKTCHSAGLSGMPGKSGLELLIDLKIQYPNLPILVLRALPEEAYARRVFKMGAMGYIQKESAPDLLVPAIRKAISGQNYISSKLADILVSDLSGKDKASIHEQLSEREFEVLRLIGTEKSVGEIAELLNGCNNNQHLQNKNT